MQHIRAMREVMRFFFGAGGVFEKEAVLHRLQAQETQVHDRHDGDGEDRIYPPLMLGTKSGMNMPTPMATSSMAMKELAEEMLYLVLPCFRPPTMAARPRMPLISNITAANTVSRASVGLGAPCSSTIRITTSTETAARVRISVP